jgi:hypothetical protein
VSEFNDQEHPQYKTDRQVLNQLQAGEPTDYNLAELARLLIRYDGFPGARDIQKDLQRLLQSWDFTEESLFAKTREIHAQGNIYKGFNRGREDWS